MATLSCADRWPEGSMELERALVAAAAQTEERDRHGGDGGCGGCSGDSPPGGGTLSLDDSLTSLQWLQDFSILDATTPQRPYQAHLFGRRPQGSDAPASPLAGDPASMGGPLTPGKPTAAAYSRLQACGGARGHCYDEVDYRTNAHVKPPYSYATLICMAMQASTKTKITLACIYKWITDNFCYYRHADPTWQNSIRHNLSLNKCFIKVPRQKDEPGKGGFWKIDPQYAERLLSGSYKKRRMPPVRLGLPPPQTPPPRGPAGGQGGLRITPESQQLLQEFEELTGPGQTWEPRLAQAAMLGSWPVVRGRGRHRKKQPPGFRSGSVKALRRSSSPLISADDQKEMGPLKGHFDWDGLLDLTLSGELALDGGEPPHTHPADGPVGIVDIQVSVKTEGGNEESDLGEETFLSASFLETSWPEDDDHDRGDFLCGPSVNLDQLFDLGDSLSGDPSGRIDVLL